MSGSQDEKPTSNQNPEINDPPMHGQTRHVLPIWGPKRTGTRTLTAKLLRWEEAEVMGMGT